MTVREQLREEAPFLHDSLVRSWRIAHETWLPAIPTSLGSHNAYPHVHNMELRLDDIAEVFAPDRSAPGLALSAVEKYLLLAAILFHDIGKTVASRDHPLESWRILIGQGKGDDHWAEYGIPSEALAGTIARLSLHHDNMDGDLRADNPLCDTSIDPYGRVRERGLRATLVLLDHLDTSHLRVLPDELSQGAKRFRNLIRGVDLDPSARLIRSVLGCPLQLEPVENEKRRLEYYALGCSLEDYYKFHCKDRPVVNQEQRSALIRKLADGGDGEFVTLEDVDLKAARAAFRKEWPGTTESLSAYAKGLHIECSDLLAKMDRAPLLLNEQLALIQRDLRRHREAVLKGDGSMKADLRAMGVTVDDWVLELDEHLFGDEGWEAWEPTFDLSYLKRVAQEMWNLSLRVFGTSVFTYDTLSAALREPDVERVKRAVRRLRIILGNVPHGPASSKQGGRGRGAIEANDLTWRWKASRSDDTNACCCVSLDSAHDVLVYLADKRQGRDAR